jgi:hypothetical protein
MAGHVHDLVGSIAIERQIEWGDRWRLQSLVEVEWSPQVCEQLPVSCHTVEDPTSESVLDVALADAQLFGPTQGVDRTLTSEGGEKGVHPVARLGGLLEAQ